MGRVFDFNMSRLCPAGSCAAPGAPPAPLRQARGAPATPRRFPISDILHCLHTSQFADTDFGFSAFPGTRVATVGVFPARAVARTPHYVYTIYRTIDRAAGTRGHARTEARTHR